MNRRPRLADNDSTVLDYHAVDTRVPFVGRAYELRALLAFLKRGGALTLVGPGGVGKSRLAHEAVTRFAREHATECIFVPLAGVMPEAVVGTVMSQLGISQEPGRSPYATLADRLRDRPAVIALDNCEHAPDETSALIDAVRAIPHITVIATSQRRLDYADETVFEVEPFSNDDGIAFFLARASLNPSHINDGDARDGNVDRRARRRPGRRARSRRSAFGVALARIARRMNWASCARTNCVQPAVRIRAIARSVTSSRGAIPN